LLENVVKEFVGQRGAPVRAVDGVSVRLEPGTLVTLLGPSGCGKTTTLRLIAGFERPTAGHILLDGQSINDIPPNKRDMAMVFQSYAIFPHLNVFENIAYGLRVRRVPDAELRKRVGDVADLCGLGQLLARQPNQLSGGQQQRVALARALVLEPRVLLFDEPLSNLDAKLRVQMREQIRSLQQQFGITAVYVTHDQAEAMVLSDLIVVMNQGKIEQAGSPFEVYRRPATEFVADFIGRANFVKGRVSEVDSAGMTVAALGSRLRAAVDGHAATVGADVTLVLRPDSVGLAEPDAERMPVGTVRRAWFVGPQHDYEIEVNGQTLAVVEYDAIGKLPRAVGERVGLDVIDRAVWVIPGS
jgi:iron(III) transport system ATP-binding protein